MVESNRSRCSFSFFLILVRFFFYSRNCRMTIIPYKYKRKLFIFYYLLLDDDNHYTPLFTKGEENFNKRKVYLTYSFEMNVCLLF